MARSPCPHPGRGRFRPSLATALTFSAALALAATPAAAQDDRQTDVAIGYLAYRNFDAPMQGWHVQVRAPLQWRWGIVAEAVVAHGSDDEAENANLRDYAGLAGIRYTWRQTPRIAPFWQVLGGAMHLKSTGTSCDPTGRCTPTEDSTTLAAFQPGVGVSVMVSSRLGIQAQVDLPVVIRPGLYAGFPRAAVSGVVSFGR